MAWRWLWRARLPDPRDVPDEGPVHDGDTLWLELDRGLDGTKTVISIRLKDVRAPETTQAGNTETRAQVAAWLAAGAGRWPYVVETFRTRTDDNTVKSFERYIGVVTQPGQPDLNGVIIQFVQAGGYPLGR